MHIHFPSRARTAVGFGSLAACLAFAAPWSATEAHANVPSVTCDGSQSVVITPGVTDALAPQTGSTTAQLGVYDSLLGLGGQDCQSTDGALTGGTFTYTFQQTVSCTEVSGTAGTFTGTINWDNGRNSAVSGTFNLADNIHGDGLLQGSGKISTGEFQGETLTLQTNGVTMQPDACERDGVKSMSGSVDVVIGPATT
jgi:hypothetical protein